MLFEAQILFGSLKITVYFNQLFYQLFSQVQIEKQNKIAFIWMHLWERDCMWISPARLYNVSLLVKLCFNYLFINSPSPFS